MSTSEIGKLTKRDTSFLTLSNRGENPSFKQVAELINTSYQSIFEQLHSKSGLKKKFLISKESTKKWPIDASELLAKIHTENSRRFLEESKEVEWGKYYAIPSDLAEKIQSTMNDLNDLDKKILFRKHDLLKELESLSIELINLKLKSDESETYLEAVSSRIEEKHRQCFKENNCLNPIQSKIPTTRKTFLELFDIESSEIKMLALTYYIDLCEADPITETTSEGLVSCLKTIFSWYNKGLINENPHIILCSKALALTLECLLLHMGSHLSGQKEEIKDEAIKLAKALENMDIHTNKEVSFWASYAFQAAASIRYERNVTSELLEGSLKALRLGVLIANAAVAPTGASVNEAISEAVNDLITIYHKFPIGKNHWFESALAVKKAMRIAISSDELFKKLLQFFCSRNPDQKQLSLSESLKAESPIESRKSFVAFKEEKHPYIFFSYLDSLELAALRSTDEKIVTGALKLIIHFFHIKDLSIQQRAIQALYRILKKGSLQARNTAQIILHLIAAQKHDEKEIQEFFIDLNSFKGNLKKITSKNKFYPSVIKYLLRRVLNSRRYQDIAETPISMLFADSDKELNGIVSVFVETPALREEKTDYKGNTIIHHLAALGNISIFDELMASSLQYSLNSQNLEGDTPAHLAIRNKQHAFLLKLLSENADPTLLNLNKQSLLYLAVQSQSVEIIEPLCEALKKANAIDQGSKSPLNLAIELDFVEGVQILEKHDVKIIESRFGITPLMQAAKLRKLKTTMYYLNLQTPTTLELAAIYNMISNDRETLTTSLEFIVFFMKRVFTDPMLHKVVSNFLSTAHPILRNEETKEPIFKNVKYNYSTEKLPKRSEMIVTKNYTKLNEELNAAEESLQSTKLIKLDELKKELDELNKSDKLTPAEKSSKSEELKVRFDQVIKEFERLKKEIYTMHKDASGIPDLMYLMLDESDASIEMIKRYLKGGANPLEMHPTGLSPVTIVAALQHHKIMKLFLDSKCLNQPPNLELVITSDPETIPDIIHAIQKLKFNNAKSMDHTQTDSLGCTALMYLAGTYCSLEGNEKVKKYFIDLPEAVDLMQHILENSDLNVKNIFEVNALIAATTHGNLKFIEILHEKRVNYDSACLQGIRPIHIAAHDSNLSLIEFFDDKAKFDCINDFGETPLHIFCGHDPNFSPSNLTLSPVNPCKLKENTPISTPNPSLVNIKEESKLEQQNELKILDLFLKKINPTAQDALGNTCLHRAALHGKPHVIQHLLEKHPELFQIPNKEGLLAIQLLLNRKIRFRDAEKIKAFNLSSLDLSKINLQSSDMTIAHLAASAQLFEPLKNYLSNNPDAAFEKIPLSGQTPLHEAAKVGFTKMLDLCQNNKLEIPDSKENTLLHIAAINGQLDFIKELVRRKSECLSKTNQDGRKAIHLAALKGHQHVVQYFIDQKVSLEDLDNMGEAPIHIATRCGHLNLVKLLHKFNSKPAFNSNEDGHNCLSISALKGHHEIVCFFLESDDSVNPTDTIFEKIARKGWYKNSSNTMKKNSQQIRINPDEADLSGHTPLYHACSKGHASVVRALLLGGASAYSKGDLGEGPLHAAVQAGYPGIIRDLLKFNKHHMEILAKDSLTKQVDNQQELPIHELFKQPFDARLLEKRNDILYYLLKGGSPPNTPDELGRTPFYLAMQSNQLELAETLLSYFKSTISIQQTDNLGNTPLHAATIMGWDRCVSFLLNEMLSNKYLSLKNKPSINIKNSKGLTPLWEATKKGYDKIFELLQTHGGDIKIVDKHGNTLYHLIYGLPELNEGHKTILEFLYRKYPEGVFKGNKAKRTPLHTLSEKGFVSHLSSFIEKLPGSPSDKLSLFKTKDNSGQTALDIATEEVKREFNTLLTEEFKGSSLEQLNMIERALNLLHLGPRRASSSSQSNRTTEGSSGNDSI